MFKANFKGNKRDQAKNILINLLNKNNKGSFYFNFIHYTIIKIKKGNKMNKSKKEKIFNYDIYFISLIQKNSGYEKRYSIENKICFIKKIEKDSYGYEINDEIIINLNEDGILINYSQSYIDNYTKYFNLIDNNIDPGKYIKKIILDDFNDFLKLDKDKDYFWKIDNKIDFEKNGKEQIELKEQFHKKEFINKFRELIEDKYLKEKHICLNPNCQSIDKTPCKSHYISNFILSNLYTQDKKEILKCYPFDIIHEDIKYKRHLLSDFVLITTAEQNIYNTARIYCGSCDNILFSNFENNSSFFNPKKPESYPEIINLLSIRFKDFIKVKNKEFEIINEGFDYLKDNDYESKINIKKRKKEINKIFNILSKEVKNSLNLKMQFEVNFKIPFAGIAFINNENIRNFFSFIDEFNLRNIDLNNGYLILNILPKKNTSVIVFHFFNLNLFEYNVINTLFLKKIIGHNENIQQFLKFCITSLLINFSEIFMSKDFFDNLSFNKKQLLLNCFLLKDPTMNQSITIEYNSSQEEMNNYINDKIKSDSYFRKEKIIDLISYEIILNENLYFISNNIFYDENTKEHFKYIKYIEKKLKKMQYKLNKKNSQCGNIITYQIIYGYKKIFEFNRILNNLCLKSNINYIDDAFVQSINKKYENLDLEDIISLLSFYAIKNT